MPNLFYKKNTETSLHVASLASIPDSNDLWILDNSTTSGSSVYQRRTYELPRTVSGNFLAIDGTSTVSYSSSVFLFDIKSQSTYSTSSESLSIYQDSLGTKFKTYSGTVFEAEVGDVFSFYDLNGKSAGLEISISEYSHGRIYMQVQMSDYSGMYIVSPAPINRIDLDPVSVSHYFSLSTDSSGSFGLCVYSSFSGENISKFAYNTTSLYYINMYYSASPYKSPLFVLLEKNSALYGASGSSPDDSESHGETGGLGLYDFPTSDIDSDDDIDSSASGASPAISAGLVNPYYVTASEIAALGNFLWSDSFYDSIAKTFSNPMDCIISLASFPVASSSMSLGSSESVRVGNTSSSSTGTRLISEFVTIDCGSVSVPEVWGSYLDYTQTKLYIYIPYLGIEELPLCECMGGSVACKLRINLLTGALVACLTLTSGTYVTGSARVQPIYFSTTCKSDIPVSGATTGALAGAFQLLGGATTAIAGVATGVAPLAVSGLASAAQGVATMQSQNSQISGAVGAAGGQMAHKTPFLIFDRPVQSVPANLASVAGYQSNSGTTLSRCSGYVICDTINLDGLALTRSELEEVEQICTSGVYIS